ncbi:uncharacterized protein VTP21DRAFT_3926 [Calcarisporiella thermophila]|uniref:uncharacterized protein n=1 Tax=Calcarisporiella thermophila TaxID=911321 RepID=UPI00374304D1
MTLPPALYFLILFVLFNSWALSESHPFSNTHKFQLKHVFHHNSQSLYRRDIADSSASFQQIFAVHSTHGSTRIPSNPDALRGALTLTQFRESLNQTGNYTPQHGVIIPDPSSNITLISFAAMTYDAYNLPDKTKDWYDVGGGWMVNSSFGWKTDGLRGHVFGDVDNTTLVVAIKGTTASLFGGGETGVRDKLNDNRLFSCCCARVDATWRTVCDCYKGAYTCSQDCIEDTLAEEEMYYTNAMKILFEVMDAYPEATIWLTGHSLGGSIASLLGLTFGIPTITFESPGDLLAARRLHLPMAPGLDMRGVPIWHIGHTADPIFMGVCTGPTSSCYYSGFAIESKCHSGKVCVYDTVKEEGWRLDIRSHRIGDVIERVLKRYEPRPCVVEEDSNTNFQPSQNTPDYSNARGKFSAANNDNNTQTGNSPLEEENIALVDTWRGWPVVLGGFLVVFNNFGNTYSWSDFYTNFEFKGQTSTLAVAFIGTIANAFMFFIGPFLGPLYYMMGLQRSMALGTSLCVLAQLLASFNTSMWQLYLTQGIMFGLGNSFLFFPAMMLPSQWFQKYRGIATGCCVAGSGIGGLCITPIVRTVIDHYGYRWSLRVTSIISFILLSSASLLCRPRIPLSQLGRRKGFNFDIVNPRLLILFCFGFLASFGYLPPFFMMATYARSVGVTPQLAAVLAGVMSGINSFGRILMGGLADIL